ncbi:MAG: hypothetical protein HY550_00380 [Elusimicrobia bacterium]|nr:hypothetical protein [Elusimicrobiota bacterium]
MALIAGHLSPINLFNADRLFSSVYPVFRSKTPSFSGVCLAAAVALVPVAELSAQGRATRYLAFQVFTNSPSPTVPAGMPVSSQVPSKRAIESLVGDIIGRLGTTGTKGRKLAFVEGPISLDHSDRELGRLIDEAFEIAVEKDIAVGFHIDDSMFWARREDLWKDPRNVEWTDWAGTPHPSRWIGWGPARHAPPMCYESPVIRKEAARIAGEVIGAAIKRNLNSLKSKGKGRLFAGVIAGWETHLPDFRYLAADDKDLRRVHGAAFPRKRIGYHALSYRGFTAKSPPADLEAALAGVVRDWVTHWTRSLNQAGIPADRIYTHIAFPILPEGREPELLEAIGKRAGFRATLLGLMNHVTPASAFNAYARPGFSTYPVGFKRSGRDALLAIILEERKKHGDPPWASAEGTNVQVGAGFGGPREGGVTWEGYLAGMFNNGAALVNVFAWGVGGKDVDVKNDPYRGATESEDAIAAYRKFLRGEPLVEDPPTAQLSTGTLQHKIQRIRSELPRWIQKDPAGRQPRAEALLRKLDACVQAHDPQGAEKAADAILGLIDKR